MLTEQEKDEGLKGGVMNCLFCGAEAETDAGLMRTHKCGSMGPNYRRSSECYEAELAAKDALLRDALGAIAFANMYGGGYELLETEIKKMMGRKW